jgi:hypothetical protein
VGNVEKNEARMRVGQNRPDITCTITPKLSAMRLCRLALAIFFKIDGEISS